MQVELSRQRTALLTDVGMVRSENQDACSEFRHAATGAQLLVVADGMGGHQGGATASRMAIETVGQVFQGSTREGPELLREALETANGNIYRAAHEAPELHGMGTTCVALLITQNGTTWVAHVGDSRAYQLRAGQLLPITADHSAVAEMERRGMITAEEAAVHPRRNELLRSIGVEPDVEVDVSPIEVHGGDQFLLCSDGLSGVVSDGEMAAVLQQQPPNEAVRALVDSANARGGPDNVTVLVTSFAGPPPTGGLPPTVPMQAAAAPPAGSGSSVKKLALAAALVGVLLVAAVGMLLLADGQLPAEVSPPGSSVRTGDPGGPASAE